VREGLPQFSHPISHRTPHYRMGKDGIVLLIAIKKRPIFRRQRDCKIQDDIDGNSLGNRCRFWLIATRRVYSKGFQLALPGTRLLSIARAVYGDAQSNKQRTDRVRTC
jgi:hypothetical protein